MGLMGVQRALWSALWLAVVLMILAAMPGAPPQLRSEAQHILGELPGASAVPGGAAPSGSSAPAETGGSLGPVATTPSSGPYSSTTITLGTIAWCMPVTPFVADLTGSRNYCGSGVDPGTAISGVVGYLDASGSLVSDQGSAADDRLASAKTIVDDPAASKSMPSAVYSEAETLVAQGDGSYVAVLSKVGTAATVVSVVFVAYEAYEEVQSAKYVAAASTVVGFSAGLAATTALATEGAICAVGAATGPGDLLICGAAYVIIDVVVSGAASTATVCALDAASCMPTGSALKTPTEDCTAPCGSTAAGPLVLPSKAPAFECLVTAGSSCILPTAPVDSADCTTPCSSTGSARSTKLTLITGAIG